LSAWSVLLEESAILKGSLTFHLLLPVQMGRCVQLALALRARLTVLKDSTVLLRLLKTHRDYTYASQAFTAYLEQGTLLKRGMCVLKHTSVPKVLATTLTDKIMIIIQISLMMLPQDVQKGLERMETILSTLSFNAELMITILSWLDHTQ
jgi:hypothetical protein